ncbi:MAG: hypothetical protein HZY75_00625 [Nocardioidaceae bacterium]|nr:MAG: hypothetical protein HZY75_00625 [Nocardioidaceae bacterium]
MPSISSTIAAAGSAALLAIAAFTTGQVVAGDPTSPPSPDNRPLDAPSSVQGGPGPGNPAELLYVPVTSCRVVDSRKVGVLGKNAQRAYYVAGATGFAAQGGKATGCGIPTTATAVVVNLWAAKPKAAGNLKAWAAGGTEPTGSSLFYTKSSTGTVQQVTVPIRSGAAKHLAIRNFKAKTHLVLDVTGYYVPPMYAYIGSSGTILDQSGRLVSATRTGTGTYTLVWDRDITTCVGQGSSDISGYVIAVYTSGNNAYVYVYNNVSGAAADYWVNVTINC